MSSIRREKKNFFIISVHVTSQVIKHFGRQEKPLFTDKIKTKSKITLIEKKKLFPEKGKSK